MKLSMTRLRFRDRATDCRAASSRLTSGRTQDDLGEPVAEYSDTAYHVQMDTDGAWRVYKRKARTADENLEDDGINARLANLRARIAEINRKNEEFWGKRKP
jgi:hypothetical protein